MGTRWYILGATLVILLVMPVPGNTAYNDANFDSSGTQISLSNGILRIGGDAASTTVSSSNTSFDIDLLPSSNINIFSDQRYKLSASTNAVFECGSDQSKLTLPSVSGSTTVTVTLVAEVCSVVGASGSNGSNGGGGGGGAVPPPVPPPPPPPPPATSTQGVVAVLTAPPPPVGTLSPVPQAPLPASLFPRDLTLGSVGNDVHELQIFLNAHGFKIADSGLGSPGGETTVFGALTKKALIAYQTARDITPAVGYFGPKTRESVNAEQGGTVLAPQTVPPAPISTSAGFDSDLEIGSSGEAVRRLQILLNTDFDTRVAETGPGSLGNETDIFGPRTKAAVIKFQLKHELPQVGRVGPATREKLKKLFGGAPAGKAAPALEISASPPVAPSSANLASLQAQLEAARAQLNLLLQELNSSPSSVSP